MDTRHIEWSLRGMVTGEWYPTDLLYSYQYSMNPPTNNAAYGKGGTRGLYVPVHRLGNWPVVAQGVVIL
jgi:hypothetical protein